MSHHLPKVYLAGPISGLMYGEAVDWREGLIKHWHGKIQALSPMRAKHYLNGSERLKAQGDYDWPMSTAKSITTRDRWDCMRSDVALVNLLGAERVSIGTVMEIAWCDMQRVPTVVVMESDNVHNHDMITEAAGFLVTNMDDAITMIEAMLCVEMGAK